MKLLWLCNKIPAEVKKAITGKDGNGLWVDHVLSGLRLREDITIRILCPFAREAEGVLDARCSYRTFRTGLPHQYVPAVETLFVKELESFCPDVIHSWGVEYAHALAMVNAAERTGDLPRMAASIQGLCGFIAEHYCEGIPYTVAAGHTFRDLVRRDNLLWQQKKFRLRGDNEKAALKKLRHIIGRTHWDRACTALVNPDAVYHSCNETLREPFYADTWQYGTCKKHRIFTSGCSYPVKGFHHLLKAFAPVAEKYPDAVIAVPGQSYLSVSPLRRSSYQRYLARLTREYGLEDRIEFLGTLDAEGMKRACLQANAFVLPSTIENSPNALGEAMLLGLPCVAADVGGVTTMLVGDKEGIVYQSTAPYLLSHHIDRIFAMEKRAGEMGMEARNHALKTHDPETNLEVLMAIYSQIGRQE